jgi:hypothetical protein
VIGVGEGRARCIEEDCSWKRAGVWV